jgi:hypothetical protein
MERGGPQEIHLYVVWRYVIAGGQPGLVELHGPVGGGEEPAAKPDFHLSGGRNDVDRVAWRHDATGYRGVAEDCSSPDFPIVEDRTAPVESVPTTGGALPAAYGGHPYRRRTVRPMATAEGRIELSIHRANYGQYLLGLLDVALLGAFKIEADGPRIIAVNSQGEKRTVRQFKSKSEAHRTLAEMSAEMEEIGRRSWCIAHDLPVSFLK